MSESTTDEVIQRLSAKDFPPYILVDFDRTLAYYFSHETEGDKLGVPIPAMLERVKRWRAARFEVRIFTARAADTNPRRQSDLLKIDAWLREHLGESLLITNAKDFGCVAIWDDLAVAVEYNTGLYLGGSQDTDPLTVKEEAVLTGAAAGIEALYEEEEDDPQ